MLTFRPASASGLRFTRREVPLVAASLALGLGAASPALADETADEGDKPSAPQTIIVTGQKDDQPGLDRIVTPILDTPQAISVVTREELEDRGLTNLNDALRNVAGISLGAGEGRFQGNNASLRGFSTVNDMFVDNVRDYGSYFRDTFDDQSIEVLKGPASILFGRGSTGGVIHRVSKKPVAEDFVRLDLLAGTDETLRIAADFNHDGALGEGSAVRFNAMYHEAGVQSRDFARVQRWGVAPKLIFGLGTETRLFIGFVHQSERNRPDYGVPWIPGTITAPGAPAAVDRSNFYGFTNDFLDTDVSIATLKLDHDFSEDWRARSIIRYSRADRGFRYSEAIIPRSTPRGTPLSSITVTRNLFEGASTDEFFQNQTDITGEFEWGGMTHTLIFGGDIAFESPTTTLVDSFNVPSTSLTAPQTVFYDSRPNSFVRLVSRPRSTGLGLFAIDTIEFGSGWSAIVGLRWDSFRTDFTGERFTREGARTDLALDRTDRNLSYRAAVVYKPAANGSIYAGFATSFNPSGEGVESVISSSRGFALSNLNLAPETSQTFEIGTKWNLLDDKFLVTASVFRIDKDQVRVPDPDVPGFNTLGGRQRVDGAEIEFRGTIMPGWQLNGSYAFLDSQTTRSSPGGPVVGAPLVQAPRHMGTIGTKVDVTSRLTLGGNLVAMGERLGQNTANSFLVAPGFAVVDLNLRYQFTEDLFVRVLVNNLFDELFYEQLHPFHVIPSAGRTALASVQWTF
ncbi:MAG: TonB-dependent siderophore receptor [Porphyrobacter sp.]|nr:TonB-dependent siderophore receptor [Porphyrobacter sp.]